MSDTKRGIASYESSPSRHRSSASSTHSVPFPTSYPSPSPSRSPALRAPSSPALLAPLARRPESTLLAPSHSRSPTPVRSTSPYPPHDQERYPSSHEPFTAPAPPPSRVCSCSTSTIWRAPSAWRRVLFRRSRKPGSRCTVLCYTLRHVPSIICMYYAHKIPQLYRRKFSRRGWWLKADCCAYTHFFIDILVITGDS